MNKVYVLYYMWANTGGNHAGMEYLVKELRKAYPHHIKIIEIPQNINNWQSKFKGLYFYMLALWLKIVLGKFDKVLFTEYLGNCSGNQTGIAIKLRQWGIKNKFIGLVHLSGNNLLKLYGTYEYIKLGAESVDNIIVFGTSLANFFADLGYKQKIITTFHYVDTNYYKPSSEPKSKKLQVIHIGSINRNFEKLGEIAKACPEIDFYVCQGKENLSGYFLGLNNVKLRGYLSERELLNLMQRSHVSLSVIEDTIGSNVITTSLACGLPQIVSDVGSNRDYCSIENAYFCKGIDDYIQALHELKNDPIKRNLMRKNARITANDLSLDKSIKWFSKQLLVEIE